jgi:transaldolase
VDTDAADGYFGAPSRRPLCPAVQEVIMKLFLDTANIDEIREAHSWGIIDGVTTNPSLIAKEGGDFVSVIHEICNIVEGPVSAETVSQHAAGMIKEGRLLAQVSEHVVVKVPLSKEGLKATKALSDDGIPVNVTLCFSANQALLAAKAGATFISPFLGRLDDVGQDGVELIEQIVAIYATFPALGTEVLAASVRHPRHMVQVALAGADVATLPFNVLSKMVEHPLTKSGNDRFMADWATVPDPDVVGQVERFLAARKG